MTVQDPLEGVSTFVQVVEAGVTFTAGGLLAMAALGGGALGLDGRRRG